MNQALQVEDKGVKWKELSQVQPLKDHSIIIIKCSLSGLSKVLEYKIHGLCIGSVCDES